MQSIPVGIVGASGYSGLELSRILALHPRVELKLLGSDKWAGETAARRAGLRGAAGKLKYAPQEKCAELARECAAIFLATPAEASLELAPRLLDAGVRVIDLSGAFRLRDSTLYPRFYGFDRPRPGPPDRSRPARAGPPDRGCRLGRDRRRQEGHRGLLLRRAGRRLPRLQGPATPAPAGDRAGAGALPDLHPAPL